MTSPRKPIFDAVREVAPSGLFNDAGNVLALDNLLDAFDVPRGVVLTTRKLHSPKAFFEAVFTLTGSLNQTQVDSINLILAAGQHLSIGHMAYVLATAWHEARFKPQAEWGKGFGRPYGKAGEYGQKQYGRGFVQLTWDRNYERADKELRLNGALLNNFDLALEPGIAARILVSGMDGGWFTGKKLADYIPSTGATGAHFRAARRIVNGTDRAAKIAEYGEHFLDCLRYGDWR